MFMLTLFIILITIILIIFAFLFGVAFGMITSIISMDTSLEVYGTTPQIESFRAIFKRIYEEKVKHIAIEFIKKEIESNSKESK